MLPGGTPYDMSSSRAHVRFTEYSVQKVDLFPAQNVAVVGDVIFSNDEIDNMDSNIGILGDPTGTPQSTVLIIPSYGLGGPRSSSLA